MVGANGGKNADLSAVVIGTIESVALPNGSLRGALAPKSFTGCVSELSSCAVQEHSYTDALRNYAEVYEAYQSYLTPTDTLAQHDYDLVGVAAANEHQLGCLNEEMVDGTVSVDAVSDEEIESCGYLGWIHHS
jgi:hypothetical protein